LIGLRVSHCDEFNLANIGGVRNVGGLVDVSQKINEFVDSLVVISN